MPRTPQSRSEAQRYRDAAEMILQQLDWCIAYLYKIRKRKLAAAVARNRAEIRRRLDAP